MRATTIRPAATTSLLCVAALLIGACGDEEAPAASAEAPEAAAPEADPEAAAPGAAEAPAPKALTQVGEDGKERAKLVTKEGSFTATWMFGNKPVRFTAPVDQVSFRIGDVPTLEFPIGHVKVKPDGLASPDKPDWAAPFRELVLTSYGTPVQVFFDVSSVTDVVGRLEGPGSEAAGIVLGGLQVNDRKLETTFGAQFLRTERGITVTVTGFEAAVADLALEESVAAFARKVGAGTPGATFSIAGTLEVPWFTGDVMPSFVRFPVTVQRAREIEIMIDQDVPDTVAAKRRLAAIGIPDALLNRLDNLTEESYQKAEAYMRDQTSRGQQLNLGSVQEEMGRNADGTKP